MVTKWGEEPDPAKRIRQHQGKLLKQYRTMRGMTQEQVATALNVTEPTVSQWENGHTAPRPHRQAELAKLLDFPWSAVFGLDRWS